MIAFDRLYSVTTSDKLYLLDADLRVVTDDGVDTLHLWEGGLIWGVNSYPGSLLMTEHAQVLGRLDIQRQTQTYKYM